MILLRCHPIFHRLIITLLMTLLVVVVVLEHARINRSEVLLRHRTQCFLYLSEVMRGWVKRRMWRRLLAWMNRPHSHFKKTVEPPHHLRRAVQNNLCFRPCSLHQPAVLHDSCPFFFFALLVVVDEEHQRWHQREERMPRGTFFFRLLKSRSTVH